MIDLDKTLFLIMARGGSKGIPDKNIKLLNGKPMILYSIDHARFFAKDDNICVSTDSLKIKKVVEEYGLEVPFLRPDILSTDTADSYDVILHALDFYKKMGISYETVFVLQPTSPLRKIEHMQSAMDLYASDLDMVVSVKVADANPYYNLFEENYSGFLYKSKASSYKRRQDCPLVYQYNGAIYIINVASLLKTHTSNFKKIKKIVMDDTSSIDIDKPIDFVLAEIAIKS